MITNRVRSAVFLLPLTLFMAGAMSAHAESGGEIYRAKCVQCHGTGVMSAPKLGMSADWAERKGKGAAVLTANAIKGINQMPPKGGSMELSDDDIGSVVAYMLSQLSGDAVAAEARPVTVAKTATAAAETRPVQVATATAAVQKPKRPAEVVKSKPPAKNSERRSRPVNAFNRLMRPPSQRNLPPMRDGIHDPSGDGTAALQHPKEAFEPMPKANSGNRVDWVGALEKGVVSPRFDLEDDTKEPIVLDLNIVREVKGSMPDVVYPHKQHTEWLDCSNCHPSIFIPKKGANNISMASILLGQQCGVCHGKVAFPVSECRKCHSKNKPTVAKK
jgi:c(7)-type cytochrome triheme protein